MDLTEDIAPVTALERDAAELIRRATARRSPIVITRTADPPPSSRTWRHTECQRRALQLLKVLAQGDRDHDVGGVQDRGRRHRDP